MATCCVYGRKGLHAVRGCRAAEKALFIAIIAGEGHVLNRRDEPLAAWALRLEKFDLFRELVKRGADVNRVYKSLRPTATSAIRTPALEALSAECVAEAVYETHKICGYPTYAQGAPDIPEDYVFGMQLNDE